MLSLERVRLGLLGLAACLAAGAIWAGVSAALPAPPPAHPLATLPAVQAPRLARREDRTPESFRALTGRTLVPPPPVTALQAGPPPFKLLAIWSEAAVVKGSDGTVGSYRVGEMVKPDGAKVLSAAGNRAVFLWRGAEIVLTLEGVPLAAVSAGGLPAKTEFTVTPDEWAAVYRDWVANPNVTRGLRMEEKGGGVRLLDSMPENFPARKYGLLPGDLVKRVNSSPLNSPLALADLLKSMSTPQGFTLEVDRGGKTFTLTIHTGQTPPAP